MRFFNAILETAEGETTTDMCTFKNTTYMRLFVTNELETSMESILEEVLKNTLRYVTPVPFHCCFYKNGVEGIYDEKLFSSRGNIDAFNELQNCSIPNECYAAKITQATGYNTNKTFVIIKGKDKLEDVAKDFSLISKFLSEKERIALEKAKNNKKFTWFSSTYEKECEDMLKALAEANQ